MQRDPHPYNTRFRQWLGQEFFAPQEWRRRLALWLGGCVVGLAAVAFAELSELAFQGFEWLRRRVSWAPLIVTPVMFALLAWLTVGAMRPTRGSGIPQVIAALPQENSEFRHRLLSLPIALGKMLLTLMALLGGASVGREGPTVHVGAGVMLWIGERFGFQDPRVLSRFVLAGGGAGVAAAFNTPLAGVVFAIEELAGSFEHRFSGIILTAVIFAGAVSLGLMGNYAYFGQVHDVLPIGRGWLSVLVCGLLCGLLGGLFARALLMSDDIFSRLRALRERRPVVFAAICGLLLALIGVLAGGAVFGTGYAEAHQLVQGQAGPGGWFAPLKLLANVLSYWAGIPGGIFAPALAVGAGFGDLVSLAFPELPGPVVVLLGMASFLAGVTQAPLTATVISLELTANRTLVLPIMAACLLGRAVSSLVCPRPIYRAFAGNLIDEYERRRQEESRPITPSV
ncbi:chloride channel protein [Pseudomarimonas arenosa]|uniref:Chloride channel protein n=1 Tax=Pseudomarimonas arenosa TaxID=2774145 RepID=A0AAW3ZPG0_9GAMM|nr:chloride channel protein [Pseudomarimonas arenosa]MBD8526176.1 chloride channel protein [Pseudomarimonas arenosa]